MPSQLIVGRSARELAARHSRLASSSGDVIVTGLMVTDNRVKSVAGRAVALSLTPETAEELRDLLVELCGQAPRELPASPTITGRRVLSARDLRADDKIFNNQHLITRVEIVKAEHADDDMVRVWIRGQSPDAGPWWILEANETVSVFRTVPANVSPIGRKS